MRSRSLTLAALLGFAAAMAGAETHEALEAGERLWRLKRTRSAIEALEQAAARAEAAAHAQLRLGWIYFFKGWEAEGAFPGWHEEVAYRERALAAFRAAVEARPDWAEPRAALGEALLRAGRAADALAAFDAALSRAPDSEAARIGRWKALFYVDREGVIRYEARGVETHGDSAERVSWYIEELKRGR